MEEPYVHGQLFRGVGISRRGETSVCQHTDEVTLMRADERVEQILC